MRTIECGGRALIVMAGRLTGSKDAALEKARMLSSGSNASVRLLDAGRVFGMDHIRSALQKASRAFDNHANVSDSLATETMLYMSGCRQIQEAVGLLGLKGKSEEIVCLADAVPGIDGRIARELPLREDDSVVDSVVQKNFSAFGLGETELKTVPEGKRIELVLERVAGVDIKKK